MAEIVSPIQVNNYSRFIGSGSFGDVYYPSYLLGKFNIDHRYENNNPFFGGTSTSIDSGNSRKFVTKIGLAKEMLDEWTEYSMLVGFDEMYTCHFPRPLLLSNRDLMLDIPEKSRERVEIHIEHLIDVILDGKKYRKLKPNSRRKKDIDALSIESRRIFLNFLVINFGGIDLSKLGERDGSMKLKLSFDYNIINGFVSLFEGVKKLLDSGLVHNDIKTPNIVYNEDTTKLMFIDFGNVQTTDLEDFRDEKCVLWFHWPIEHIFLNEGIYKRFLDIEEDEINNYIKTIVDFLFHIRSDRTRFKINKLKYLFSDNNKDLWKVFKQSVINWEYVFIQQSLIFDQDHSIKSFDDVMVNITYSLEKTMVNEMKKQFTDFLIKIHKERYKHSDFVRSAATKIDLYGVGLSLSYILSSTIREQRKLTLWNNLRILSLKCLNFNMFERCDIDSAITEYINILRLYNNSRGGSVGSVESVGSVGSVESADLNIFKFQPKNDDMTVSSDTDMTVSSDTEMQEIWEKHSKIARANRLKMFLEKTGNEEEKKAYESKLAEIQKEQTEFIDKIIVIIDSADEDESGTGGRKSKTRKNNKQRRKKSKKKRTHRSRSTR